MEMGLLQADAAIHLNASHSVVHRLWNQYQTKHLYPEGIFQADHELQHLQETVLSLLRPEGEEGFLCRNLLQTILQHQKEEYPLVRCEGVFTIQVSMQSGQLCVHPSTDDKKGPTYVEQKKTLTGPESDGLLYCLQTSLDSQWRAIPDVCSFGGNEAPDIINQTLERRSYRGGGIRVSAGISLGGHINLHLFQEGTLTGVRYREEVRDSYVRQYTGVIGDDFILMDDNARPQ